MFLAVVVPCFWVAAAAAAHAQVMEPQDVVGTPDPRPVEDTFVVDPEPGPLPPGPPLPVGRSVAIVTGKSASGNTAKTNATQGTYSFFFSHLDHLDQEADRQAALGNEQAATEWRTYEQLAAGLNAHQGKLLKQVAHDCNQALEKKDREIRALVKAFRDQHPNGAFLKAPPPPELEVLWQGRLQIIDQHIAQLRSLLGEERFLYLDAYVHSAFASDQVSRVTAPVKGGSR
jgi:hypothetical protein